MNNEPSALCEVLTPCRAHLRRKHLSSDLRQVAPSALTETYHCQQSAQADEGGHRRLGDDVDIIQVEIARGIFVAIPYLRAAYVIRAVGGEGPAKLEADPL